MSSSGGYLRLPGGKTRKKKQVFRWSIRELKEETELQVMTLNICLSFMDQKFLRFGQMENKCLAVRFTTLLFLSSERK